jgi:predicted nuclease of predicted toxin-antitoxin system
VRLLADANLSPSIVPRLISCGHDAQHVADVGLLTASDQDITRFAAANALIIVTADTDFGTLLARSGDVQPSVVLLRHHFEAPADEQARLVVTVLEAAAEDLAAGAIATLNRGRLRVRRLPIR